MLTTRPSNVFATDFNFNELMSRCWAGTPGKMVLGSKHFERYWAKFTLSWGVQLYLDLIKLGTHLHL